MNTIKTIYRKEIKKFFLDARLLIITVFLPGGLLFGVYTLLGILLMDEDGMAALLSEAGEAVSVIVPVLLMVFMLLGCISSASESIAGEKEKGTMSAILAAPVKKVYIAAGKMLALSTAAAVSGLSSAAGMAGALAVTAHISHTAGMDKQITDGNDMGSGIISYIVSPGISGYITIILIIISSVLMMVGLVCIISALSDSVKEAQVYITPLMLVVIAVCLAAAFGSDAPVQAGQKLSLSYGIPFWGSIRSLTDIMSGIRNMPDIVVTVSSNLLVSLSEVFLLALLLGNEKVMSVK